MKSTPILFNGEMVRAILDGRKTQTRRIIKPQPSQCQSKCDKWIWRGGKELQQVGYGEPYVHTNVSHVINAMDAVAKSRIGTRLWVRETFYTFDGVGSFSKYKMGRVWYKADGLKTFKWTPSIHMPRWASRITLEITDVKVERVQEISEEDAIAEGIEGKSPSCWRNYILGKPDSCEELPPERFAYWNSPIDSFHSLWNSVYGNWNENPFVWVIHFKKL